MAVLFYLMNKFAVLSEHRHIGEKSLVNRTLTSGSAHGEVSEGEIGLSVFLAPVTY